MNKSLLSLIFFFAVCSTHIQSQTIYFVSTGGKDTNTGTKENPFKSIERAQIQARQIQDTVTIYLREGVYYISRPIVFTSTDSRPNNYPLIFKNYENEEVIISGGVSLDLEWVHYRDGMYQAEVPPDLKFDQLFVNGTLQRMARYPNYDPSARFLGGSSADAISKERVKNWESPETGYVHALHRALWGGFHYIVTGKNDHGELLLEGGWQNNRQMGMHNEYLFVENIFEELDTVNEWFFDKEKNILFYFPPEDLDLPSAIFETPQIAHLFDFKGTESDPVTNIMLEGLTFTHTLRTFMNTNEPLLRSDWTIYRGGAVLFEGARNCRIHNCSLINLGGNAIFFNGFNRHNEVSGCLIKNVGASAICFVGDPNAVYSPNFEYHDYISLNAIDRTPGPKTNNYPADCIIFDNLMYDLGLVEKQSAGVQISMSMDISIIHNTIHDVPRAGINIGDGTWGGHIIEYNDVFNTVKETGDHGAFNSWGRDRYWHPDRNILDSIVDNYRELVLLDAIKTTIIRNNRWRCNHGWDIDLDDGSSNYKIYNNLCLNGGIKLREGINRTVENNIMVNNSFHPHVWFLNSQDAFRHNIVSTAYKPIQIRDWGNNIDYNFFPDSVSLKTVQSWGTDSNSVYGNPLFINPQTGDFRVKEGSPALEIGFNNFRMDNFGVISPELKAIAKKVDIPGLVLLDELGDDTVIDFMGARLKNLSTMGEQSATGMNIISGILVIDVENGSPASLYFQPNDVILSFNNRNTNQLRDLLDARMTVIGSNARLVIFRNQKEMSIRVVLHDKK